MSADGLRERADAVLARASALEEEGLPFPTSTIRDAVEGALEAGESDRAKILVDRTELLVNQTAEHWAAIKELLEQA
ncbi:MAG: hypothetical protein L3J93_03665 [Thermoplasmata archaeon]|nr:hypothetical protein [Thermoplasmata archaeon]